MKKKKNLISFTFAVSLFLCTLGNFSSYTFFQNILRAPSTVTKKTQTNKYARSYVWYFAFLKLSAVDHMFLFLLLCNFGVKCVASNVRIVVAEEQTWTKKPIYV